VITEEKQNLVDAWTAEHEMGGNPSSKRITPSGAVIWAVEQLRAHKSALRTVTDIGCGKGRNSIYLAQQGMQVTAMDFTPQAIRHTNDVAAEHKLEKKIRAITYDVTEDWPIAPASMDLVVDAFCFKHITAAEGRAAYKENLLRILRTHGHYLISFNSIGDGYYGRYVIDRVHVNDEELHLVVDPANNISSVLFTPQHILEFFGPQLDLFAEMHHNKPHEIHGQVHESSIYAMLLKRTHCAA